MRSVAALAVSALARVEVPAAIWRKHRLGELETADASTLARAFTVDFAGATRRPPRFAVVPVTATVLEEAAHAVGRHGLRAYDAVQLASALAVRSADANSRTLACFDGDLRAAGAVEGFELIPA